MALSKERKVYLGVLGVAGLALAIDFVLPNPDEADASAEHGTPMGVGPAGESDPDSVDIQGDGANQIALTAKRLHELEATLRLGGERAADPFTPGPLWAPPESGNEYPDGPTSIERAAVFAARHTLTAVLESRAGAGAVVDGVFLQVGESLEEFELVAVGDRTAVFQSGDAVAILEIEGGGRRVTGPR